jgi:hypothetical protein
MRVVQTQFFIGLLVISIFQFLNIWLEDNVLVTTERTKGRDIRRTSLLSHASERVKYYE